MATESRKITMKRNEAERGAMRDTFAVYLPDTGVKLVCRKMAFMTCIDIISDTLEELPEDLAVSLGKLFGVERMLDIPGFEDELQRRRPSDSGAVTIDAGTEKVIRAWSDEDFRAAEERHRAFAIDFFKTLRKWGRDLPLRLVEAWLPEVEGGDIEDIAPEGLARNLSINDFVAILLRGWEEDLQGNEALRTFFSPVPHEDVDQSAGDSKSASDNNSSKTSRVSVSPN